jgi:hypothetical protein
MGSGRIRNEVATEPSNSRTIRRGGRDFEEIATLSKRGARPSLDGGTKRDHSRRPEMSSMGFPVGNVAVKVGYGGVSAFITIVRGAFGTTSGMHVVNPAERHYRQAGRTASFSHTGR